MAIIRLAIIRLAIVVLIGLTGATSAPAKERSAEASAALSGVVREGDKPVAARVSAALASQVHTSDPRSLLPEASRLGALLFYIGALEPRPKAAEPHVSTAAGADGRYTLTGLSKGWHRITATTKDGRRGSAEVFVRIAGAAMEHDIALGPPKRRIVRGRVRFADGRPYTGRVVPVSFPMVTRIDGPGVQADKQGRFHLAMEEDPHGGGLWIAALRPRRACIAWPVPDADEVLDLVIDRDSRRVTGVVVDEVSGAPVGNAAVYMFSTWTARPRRFARALTDACGRFLFPSAPRGPTSLIALSRTRGHVMHAVEDQAHVRMRLPRAAHVRGRVRALPREGLPPGLKVHAWLQMPHSWPTHITCSVDADGRFDFGAFPPSRALLYAVSPGWVSAGLGAYVLERQNDLPNFLAQPGDRKVVGLRLERAGRVSGRVLDEAGRPIAGAVVQLHIRQDGEESIGGRPPDSAQRDDQVACTDRAGAFVIRTLLPGVPYELLVTRAGYAYTHSRPLRAASGETVRSEVRMKRK